MLDFILNLQGKWANLKPTKKAEENAKKDLKGLWATFDFEAENERKAKEIAEYQSAQGERESFPISVTDVRSGSNFSFQILNSEINALNELSASLKKEKFSKEPIHTPQRNDIVAARYTTDDQWYRAQIIGDDRPKGSKDAEPNQYEVRYIDYGNREWIDKDRIRQLPEMYLDLLKPFAHDAQLYLVKAPTMENEFGRDSAEGFRELVWGKELHAQEVKKERIPSKDKEPQYIHYLILFDDDKNNVNMEMISRGYARVTRDKKIRDVEVTYNQYQEAEETAKKERFNIWQYGDYPDSEEERDVERSLLR